MGKRRSTSQALGKLADPCSSSESKRRRGTSPTIHLLIESGQGLPYTQIPSTARFKAAPADQDLHNYFKLPIDLWLEGHVQAMSAKALAMLMVLSEGSQGVEGREVWWSNSRFEERYGLSRATRSEGCRELFARRLAQIQRRPVATGPSSFAPERMRNVYELIGLPATMSRDSRCNIPTTVAQPGTEQMDAGGRGSPGRARRGIRWRRDSRRPRGRFQRGLTR